MNIIIYSYAVKSRRAERKKDEASQRMYYKLMLKEDSDAALLRIFECFLEAAPQQVLQTSLLLRVNEEFAGTSIFTKHARCLFCLRPFPEPAQAIIMTYFYI